MTITYLGIVDDVDVALQPIAVATNLMLALAPVIFH